MLYFIAMNCGELVCAEIVTQMWKMHMRDSRLNNDPEMGPNLPLNDEKKGKKRTSTNSSSPVNSTTNNNNDMSEV